MGKLYHNNFPVDDKTYCFYYNPFGYLSILPSSTQHPLILQNGGLLDIIKHQRAFKDHIFNLSNAVMVKWAYKFLLP